MSRVTGLDHDFGTLYSRWLYQGLQDTAFSFLREAFADYLGQRYTGGVLSKRVKAFEGEEAKRLQERRFVSKRQAMNTLGVGERVLQSLLGKGFLRSQKKPIGIKKERNIYFIEKDSLETLRREWFDLLPLQTVAHTIIGTTEATVLTLGRAGLLIPAQGPAIEENALNLWLYKKAEVEQFVTDVLQRCIKGPLAKEDGIYLTSALLTTKLGLADMLAEILNGKLMPVDLGMDEPLLRRLMLSREELRRCIEEEEYRQREGMGFFTIDEGAALLGITTHIFSRYVRLGLLESEKLAINGRKARILFRRQTLEAFRHKFVAQSEAAALLHLEMSTLHNYIHMGWLHPAHKVSRRLLLFLREEVESLAPPTSLSLHQASSFLGITSGAVVQLVCSGQLPAVGPVGKFSKPIHILRSDLEAYQQRKAEEVKKFVREHRLKHTADEEVWISAREAADVMGVESSTMRRWAQQNQIPASKQILRGLTVYRIKLEDLERFSLGKVIKTP